MNAQGLAVGVIERALILATSTRVVNSGNVSKVIEHSHVGNIHVGDNVVLSKVC